jgi:hypothetical protein
MPLSQGNRFQQQLQAAAQKRRTARDIEPAIAAAGMDNAQLTSRMPVTWLKPVGFQTVTSPVDFRYRELFLVSGANDSGDHVHNIRSALCECFVLSFPLSSHL